MSCIINLFKQRISKQRSSYLKELEHMFTDNFGASLETFLWRGLNFTKVVG